LEIQAVYITEECKKLKCLKLLTTFEYTHFPKKSELADILLFGIDESLLYYWIYLIESDRDLLKISLMIREANKISQRMNQPYVSNFVQYYTSLQWPVSSVGRVFTL